MSNQLLTRCLPILDIHLLNLLCPRHKQARDFSNIVKFLNLHVIDYLHVDHTVEVPISVRCLKVVSLRIKAIPEADYVVSASNRCIRSY